MNIKPVSPFRLDLTVWALRRRPDNAVDRCDDETYRRVLNINGKPAEVSVRQTSQPDDPNLAVTISGISSESNVKATVLETLNRLLGCEVDLTEFYEFASHRTKPQSLIQRFRGVKPPRFPTLFEALVNGITCQQITLRLGIILLNRLANEHGVAYETENGAFHAFPRPEDIASLEPYSLRPLGLSRQKSRAIIELANTTLREKLSYESFEGFNDQETIERLNQLRGVGRWTAEYVLLRGFGRLNMFPADDVGARNFLGRWLNLSHPLDYEGVHRALGNLNPFGGIVYFHMLLNRLASEGYI